jgi:hypothetical protein
MNAKFIKVLKLVLSYAWLTAEKKCTPAPFLCCTYRLEFIFVTPNLHMIIVAYFFSHAMYFYRATGSVIILTSLLMLF